MQHPEQRAHTAGKVIPLRDVSSKNESAPHPEAIVGEKIVTILKDMFKSWRSPKAQRAR